MESKKKAGLNNQCGDYVSNLVDTYDGAIHLIKEYLGTHYILQILNCSGRPGWYLEGVADHSGTGFEL